MSFKHLCTGLLLLCSHPLVAAPENGAMYGAHQHNIIYPSSQKLVIIDSVASGPVDIALTELQALGLVSSSVAGQLISGALPIASLSAAKRLQSINQINENRTITAVGHLSSEGDKALRSIDARQSFGVDGNGVSVAVISDSYNCLGGEEEDRASDDLPAQTTVIEEAMFCDGMVDEGRAIMHLVHDIAPGAKLLFLSAFNGYANTANGIVQLATEHKVDIIVDDSQSLGSPFFQKGVLAQAVEQAVQRGVTYITAAGNSGRLSYQDEFRNSLHPVFNLNAHDFDRGAGTDIYQRIEIPEGSSISLVLQWASPAFSVTGSVGASSDLDIHLVNSENETIVAETKQDNLGRDPVEVLEYYNPEGSGYTQFDLLISKVAGPNPSHVKYILFNRFEGTIAEHHTQSGTIFGHSNVQSALTVGAGNYLETPAFGYASPLLQSFSSAGGNTPWLFDKNGDRISNPQSPEKPDVIAPDNVNIALNLGLGEDIDGDGEPDGEDSDGDGYHNFRGTSAAAPHAAGVAALMLQVNNNLQPQDIKTILQLTAVDVTHRNDVSRTYVGEEFDLDSGYGLIDAQRAVSLASTYNASSVNSADSFTNESLTAYQASSGTGSFDLWLAFVLAAMSLVYSRGSATRGSIELNNNSP